MSPRANHDETEIMVTRFVRHAGFSRPTPLQSMVVPLIMQGKDLLIEARHGDGKTGAMVLPLLAQLRDRQEPTIKALILTGSKKKIVSILHQFKRFAPRNGRRPSIAAVGYEENVRKELKGLKKPADILVGTPDRVIDHIRRDNVELSNVEYSVLDIPDDLDEFGFDKDILYIYSKLPGKQQTIAFSRDIDDSSPFESILKRPQTVYRTNWDTKPESKGEEEIMSDTEKNADAISNLVKRIKESENPEILNHYRKIFRRNIPLHLRGYVSAMFLKDYLGGDTMSSSPAKPKKKRQEKTRPADRLSNDDMQSLFVSIGKNRKVFPKDLIKLLSDSGAIDQADIGAIKILDSYSFIDVPREKADGVIKALNETEFRGRSLTVNHARKKR